MTLSILQYADCTSEDGQIRENVGLWRSGVNKGSTVQDRLGKRKEEIG